MLKAGKGEQQCPWPRPTRQGSFRPQLPLCWGPPLTQRVCNPPLHTELLSPHQLDTFRQNVSGFFILHGSLNTAKGFRWCSSRKRASTLLRPRERSRGSASLPRMVLALKMPPAHHRVTDNVRGFEGHCPRLVVILASNPDRKGSSLFREGSQPPLTEHPGATRQQSTCSPERPPRPATKPSKLPRASESARSDHGGCFTHSLLCPHCTPAGAL